MARSRDSSRYLRFREILIDERQKAGLTQQQLAQKLESSQAFVSNYERGERRLDVIEFVEVCEALGISPERLIKKMGR